MHGVCSVGIMLDPRLVNYCFLFPFHALTPPHSLDTNGFFFFFFFPFAEKFLVSPPTFVGSKATPVEPWSIIAFSSLAPISSLYIYMYKKVYISHYISTYEVRRKMKWVQITSLLLTYVELQVVYCQSQIWELIRH